MTLGEIAYNAYCAERGWTSVRGEQLPDFNKQTPDLKQAWEVGAKAVEVEVKRLMELNKKS